jgi:hypothetical protein
MSASAQADHGVGRTAVSSIVPAILSTIWALSRTIGLPIGPEAWMPEPVSTVDVTATLMELLLVVSVVLTGPVLPVGHRADV